MSSEKNSAEKAELDAVLRGDLKTDHPGFMRREFTVEDAGKILDEIQKIWAADKTQSSR